MPVLVHDLSYKCKEMLGGRTDHFIVCTCGVRILYEPGREDPWKKLTAHIKAVVNDKPTTPITAAKPKHIYDGTYTRNGITFVKCHCTWEKKLKPSKDPRNVWEGHRGFFENQERKSGRKPNIGPKYDYIGSQSSKKNTSFKNSWSGNYKKDWDRIMPIAIEIFGGTTFALPNNSK